jgi:hypothetical protein
MVFDKLVRGQEAKLSKAILLVVHAETMPVKYLLLMY